MTVTGVIDMIVTEVIDMTITETEGSTNEDKALCLPEAAGQAMRSVGTAG